MGLPEEVLHGVTLTNYAVFLICVGAATVVTSIKHFLLAPVSLRPPCYETHPVLIGQLIRGGGFTLRQMLSGCLRLCQTIGRHYANVFPGDNNYLWCTLCNNTDLSYAHRGKGENIMNFGTQGFLVSFSLSSQKSQSVPFL